MSSCPTCSINSSSTSSMKYTISTSKSWRRCGLRAAPIKRSASPFPGRDTHQTTDRHGNTYVGRRFWSKAYRDLIDNESMLPILEEILGDPVVGPCPCTHAGRASPLVPARSRQYTLQAWPETDRRPGQRRDAPRRPGQLSYHLCV